MPTPAPPPVSNAWFKVQTAVPEVTNYRLENTSLFVVGTSERSFSTPVYMGVVDKDGVLDADPSTAVYRGFQAELLVNYKLAVGDYAGNFEVRLCRDDPTVCAQPVEGSPWSVPYKIKVRGGNVQDSLRKLPGGLPWSTRQGNAAHTGFVAATIDPARFTRRWAKPVTEPSTLTVGNGRVYVSPRNPGYNTTPLFALYENDGLVAWRYEDNRSGIGGSLYTGEAAVDGDRVWVSVSTIYGQALKALDSATGQVLASSSPGGVLGWAPVVADGGVFMPDGNGSILSRYNKLDGGRQWVATPYTPVAQMSFARWAPAVVDGRAYLFDSYTLWVLDSMTGAMKASLDVTPHGNNFSSSGRQVVAVGPGRRLYVNDFDDFWRSEVDVGSTRLLAFDLDKLSLLWKSTGISSAPVVVGDTVLVSAFRTLRALDAATGALKWSWEAPLREPYGQLDTPLIAVGGYAFVGVDGVTYAVDLQTHQAVWQYPVSGRMAVSENGVLYIAESVVPYRVVAINLQGGPEAARQSAARRASSGSSGR